MGKIVKYCSACEEGFAEKFGFCPNCGAHLSAFEMNPVTGQTAAEPPNTEAAAVEEVEATAPAAGAFETLPKTEPAIAVEAQTFSAEDSPAADLAETREFFEFDEEVLEDQPVEDTKTFAAETTANGNGGGNFYEATYKPASNGFQTESKSYNAAFDDGYHVTVVEEKNVRTRNLLLLGSALLFFSLFTGGLIYSVFNKFVDIAAIDSDRLSSYIADLEPVEIEEVPEEEKEKDKGGGGGGGGKDEETPASKGRTAAQVSDPLFAPSISYTKVTNPDLAIQAATKNKNEREAEKTNDYYGLNRGGDILSDGNGTGGGQGGGKGRGQGDGEGGGLGNGKGDGRGNGDGDGEGDGKGGGGNNFDPNKITVKKGVTEGVKILSKPRANYTDSARQNQVQGKVVLRVTFQANGTIGSISPVSGLPNGLTEQAIAAARGIRFEPAKRNGSPYSVTKTIEYSFTIY